METLRFHPPESVFARELSTSSSRKSCVISFMRCSVFSFENPNIPAMSARFSLTVRFSATAVSCGEIPTSCFTAALSLDVLCPQMNASPAVGAERHVSMRIVVVLPAPFTPSSEKSSPCSTVRSRLFTAVFSLYFFVSPFV